MVRLFKTKYNIGRIIKDSEGNRFKIDEAHSGFVWLRNDRGLKQIGKSELKYFKEVLKR